MEAKELLYKHPLTESYTAKWDFFGAMYDGIEEIINKGVIVQNERESVGNFRTRLEEAYTLGYSQSIVNIFNRFLHSKPDLNDYKELGKDELFKMFLDDSDLYGTSWDTFKKDTQKNASIYGVVGVLIDKGRGGAETRSQEKEQGLYPYTAMFSPQNILDWHYIKDVGTGRPELAYLKLLESDNIYLIWTKEVWERWKLQSIQVEGTKQIVQKTVLIESGTNLIGEIPFVWWYNLKHRKERNLGVSDLANVAYIEASMIRNLSHGEEVIKWAAHPQLRKPKKEASSTGEDETIDETGVTAVMEFDPDKPESKPDWLESEVKEPIDAIETWILMKIAEIYRNTNVGDVATAEARKQVKSGEALKLEFQMLNSVLVAKSKNEIEAEKACLYFWTLWQNLENLYPDIVIDRTEDFSINELKNDLENAILSKTIITTSETYDKEIDKRISKQMLTGSSDDTLAQIDKEIEEAEPLQSSTEIVPDEVLDEEETPE